MLISRIMRGVHPAVLLIEILNSETAVFTLPLLYELSCMVGGAVVYN